MDCENMGVAELKALARQHGLRGYSRLRKAELIALIGRIYKTQTYEQLTWGSSNVVHAIHCIRCGLMYVGETGRSL